MSTMSDEEKASFIWGGTRARPRKGIERVLKTGETFLKPPGSCQSKFPGTSVGVEIECCEKCSIYVLDPCEQVQVSECIGCRIVVGPCVGSVLIFDCIDCTIAVAGKQVRLRDCQNCELRTYAPTSECVVIETSKGLKFGCWDVAYPGLAAQFASCGWPPEQPDPPSCAFANYWDKIFDFSPAKAGVPNWAKLPGVDPAGRWCELAVTPTDGSFNAGTVEEKRSNAPQMRGCECPCVAQDGAKYEADWFDPAAAALLGTAKRAAAEAAQASRGAVTYEKGVTVSTGPPAAAKPAASGGGLLSRVLTWLGLKKKPPAAEVAYTTNAAGGAGGGGVAKKQAPESTTCNVM